MGPSQSPCILSRCFFGDSRDTWCLLEVLKTCSWLLLSLHHLGDCTLLLFTLSESREFARLLPGYLPSVIICEGKRTSWLRLAAMQKFQHTSWGWLSSAHTGGFQ